MHACPDTTPATSRDESRAAWFLVGPTAVGKSAVAHRIAREAGYDILSADAMLVYRGMDIGTAKPTARERSEVRYWGLDLVTPDRSFSVGDYLEHARHALAGCRAENRRVIVVGGTGLYLKCLTEGLDALPGADGLLREQAEELLERGGLAALQAALRERDAAAYEALADKSNPRRLIRALELAHRGATRARAWAGPPSAPFVGLRMRSPCLRVKIRQRAEAMFAGGLLTEVQTLETLYGKLSRTALQAIGYREALAVLHGEMTLDRAVAETARRTGQLAKRQMTWFRHQARVDWIDVEPDTPVEAVAARVRQLWDRHGPTRTAC